MKEVMAFIRMNMINKTKNALLAAGFPSITCRKVMGRGKKKVNFTLVQNTFKEAVKETPNLVEAVSEEHRLVPKRFLTLIVQDNEVKKAVDAIMEANSTGNPGDGKIFVIPVTEVYRIRTGESGRDAV
jgi:nitrogen regulatory protein PII 2